MQFEPTESQAALRATVASFCQEHATPQASEALDRAPRYPDELHQALCDAGILGHCLPEEFGGGGGGLIDLAIISEELASCSNAAVNILFVNVAVGTLLSRAGTAEQRADYLPRLVSGEMRSCFALTEPGAGSDAGAIACRAVRAGDVYRLTGTKLYATGAADADAILVVARSAGEGKASRASSLFMVPRDSERLTVTPMEKIAGNAIASCKLEFDGVEVPVARRIGPENQAWSSLMLTAAVERITVAAASLGQARHVFAMASAFATERRQFGQPIAQFQAIANQLVDIATEAEAMRWLVYAAAWKIDAGQTAIKDVCMAKLYSTERLSEIVHRGMRILGGRAYLMQEPMQRVLRESMLGLYAGGTAEIQRNIIAKQLGLGTGAGTEKSG